MLLTWRDDTVAVHLLSHHSYLIENIQKLSPGLGLVACCCIWELDAFRDVKTAQLSSTCRELLLLWRDEHPTDELLFCLNVLSSEEYAFYDCAADMKELLRRFTDDVLTTAQEKLTGDKHSIASHSISQQPDNVADIVSDRESDKREARRGQLQDIRGSAKRLRSLLEGSSDKVH